MATIYIDPNASGTGTGTFNDPYKSWSSVHLNFSGGANEYLQKNGTTAVSPGRITVNASGLGIGQELILGVYDAVTGARIKDQFTETKIYAATDYGLDVGASRSHVKIEGLNVFGVRRVSANPTCFYKDSGAGTHFTTRYCRGYDLRGSGASVWKSFANDSLVEYCEFYDTDHVGIFPAGSRATIRYNKVHTVAVSDNNEGDCIQGYGDLQGIRIIGNHLDHRNINSKQTIILQDTGSIGGGLIFGNVLLGADPSMTLYSANNHKTLYVGVQNVAVVGNYIEGGEYAVFAEAVTGVGLLFSGNVVYQPYDGCLYGITLGSGAGQKAYNNTVIRTSGTLSDTSQGIAHFTGGDATIKNNIVVGYHYGLRRYSGAESNNDVFACGEALVDTGFSPVSLDASSITSNPLLDASYRPRAGSPCIGAGVYIPGAKHMGGMPMNASSPDIGAYRYRPERRLVLARAF